MRHSDLSSDAHDSEGPFTPDALLMAQIVGLVGRNCRPGFLPMGPEDFKGNSFRV